MKITQIGRYQLLKQIGRGGMAKVYLAKDPAFQREVAVKLIDGSGLTTPILEQRFENEARVIANLEHFAIVPVYDFGIHDGHPYMVMRLMTGGTLEDRLAQGRLSWDDIDTILGRMCAALDKAHANKIVHRDLKPGNIMFDDQGVPYLADFGIARVIEGTQTRSVIGTPSYMAPEQARGEDLDPRTDVYQMGVILYEMLTGHRPFEGSSITELVMKHVAEPVPPLSTHAQGLPTYLENVIQSAMAKQPADRPPSAGALYRRFGRQPEPIASTPSQPEIPKVNPISKPHGSIPLSQPVNEVKGNFSRWVWGGLGLTALVILGWLAFSFFDGGILTNPVAVDVSETPEVVVVVVTQIATSPPETVESEPPPPSLPPPTETLQPPTATPEPPSFTLREIGRSAAGNPLEVYQFGQGENPIIFIGGLHAGFAPATVGIAQQLIEILKNQPADLPANVSVYVIPVANPDSPIDPGELPGRLNGNGVDLNRNWDCDWVADARWAQQPVSGGERPFSEPETQVLAEFIRQVNPVGVVFWEARATSGLVSPGGCQEVSQVSIDLAQSYASGSRFPLSDFENVASYDVNGDGTNWLDQQGIPAIAILLRSYSNYNWDIHSRGIREVIDYAAAQ
ncbi:MAG: protein kinase [Ardenticatenaceae bacterium]|nr:protein kinase [Ardenticatenaceae bacterium]